MSEHVPDPSRPLLVYDGECDFCRTWIGRWGKITGERVAYAPYQSVAHRFPEIPSEGFRESVHLIEPDGRWSRGAEAVFRSLARVPRHGVWLWLYQHIAGFAAMSEWGYRLVARNRERLARIPVLGRGAKPRKRGR